MSPDCTCYCLEKSDSLIVVTHLAVSKSQEICLTGARDGKVRMWNLREMIELVSFEGHLENVTALVITHNDLLGIFASHDHCIKVRDLQQSFRTKN